MFGGVPAGTTPAVQAVAEQKPALVELFLSGLKAGLLTFGGAYTVIPFLRDDAVRNGWMTDAQFLDGLALSGILPAPLIIFSTFVGYFGGGPLGAIAMTVGIFRLQKKPRKLNALLWTPGTHPQPDLTPAAS